MHLSHQPTVNQWTFHPESIEWPTPEYFLKKFSCLKAKWIQIWMNPPSNFRVSRQVPPTPSRSQDYWVLKTKPSKFRPSDSKSRTISPSLGIIDTIYTKSRGYALLLVFNVLKLSFWTVQSHSDYLRTNLTNLASQRKDASASPGFGENGGARVGFDGNETLK